MSVHKYVLKYASIHPSAHHTGGAFWLAAEPSERPSAAKITRACYTPTHWRLASDYLEDGRGKWVEEGRGK